MPTFNRRRLAPLAIWAWQRQTWPNRQLIVIDDGSDGIGDLLPADDGVVYWRLNERAPTGRKRNLGCEIALGEIICHWDDDDWSHPQRIARQVERLRVSGQQVTGYRDTLYWREADGRFYLNNGPPEPAASGTSQCYWKRWWEKHRFPDITVGEDSEFFLAARAAGQLDSCRVGHMMVARAHASSTCEIDFAKLKHIAPPPEFMAEYAAFIEDSSGRA